MTHVQQTKGPLVRRRGILRQGQVEAGSLKQIALRLQGEIRRPHITQRTFIQITRTSCGLFQCPAGEVVSAAERRSLQYFVLVEVAAVI
jgi:hypothetical protein